MLLIGGAIRPRDFRTVMGKTTLSRVWNAEAVI